MTWDKRPAWWQPDHDEPRSIDDLWVPNCDVHLERMHDRHYWLGIYVGETLYHVDLALAPKRRRINAYARELFPPVVKPDVRTK